MFDGNEIRGLGQNPETKRSWAKMAWSGKKVMQFLSEGRYMANVVDGQVNHYGTRAERTYESTNVYRVRESSYARANCLSGTSGGIRPRRRRATVRIAYKHRARCPAEDE